MNQDEKNRMKSDLDRLRSEKDKLAEDTNNKDKIVGNLAQKLSDHEKLEEAFNALEKDFNALKDEMAELKPFAAKCLKDYDDLVYNNKNISIEREGMKDELKAALDTIDKMEYQKKKLLITHAITSFELDRLYVKLYGDTNKSNKVLDKLFGVKSPGLRRSKTKEGPDSPGLRVSLPNPLTLAVSQVDGDDSNQLNRNSVGSTDRDRRKKNVKK